MYQFTALSLRHPTRRQIPNDCPSASKATLMNMDKYFMWIHYERLHNHNKAKHNKTVCIFLGIYCMSCNPTWRHWNADFHNILQYPFQINLELIKLAFYFGFVCDNIMPFGHVAWRPLLGLLSCYPLILVKSLKSFQDWIPQDDICGYVILKWVPLNLCFNECAPVY